MARITQFTILTRKISVTFFVISFVFLLLLLGQEGNRRPQNIRALESEKEILNLFKPSGNKNEKTSTLLISVLTRLNTLLNKTSSGLSFSLQSSRQDVLSKDFESSKVPDGHTVIVKSSELPEPFRPIMTAADKAILLDLAGMLSSVCALANLTYFMYGGTLLGSYRHHDIIPWDDDMDVLMDAEDKDEVYSALSAFSPEYHVFTAGPRLKFYSKRSKKSTKYPWKWPYIDIHFYVSNKTHIIDSAREFSEYAYLKSAVFPLHPRPLGYLFLNAPHDSYAVIKETYKNYNCETHYYSHKQELFRKSKRVWIPCDKLKQTIPFVHRSGDVSGVRETLMINDAIVHSLVIQEPTYAVSKSYTLELVDDQLSNFQG